MWTNVFKIGGLHQISWFQFLPQESDLNPLPDKSVKGEQKDATTLLVLSSHLQLQKEGYLSTWTNSFVGPWDPSQGLHNPDEKIKLWLFLPGRHSSVVECAAQLAVSKLRVVASGLWSAPGDSEEVAAALSQALRNCIERAFTGLSYVRFGDVFSRFNPFSQNDEYFRRGQPTVEFIFSATEEAIFVHVLISAKHVRAVSSGDIEGVSKHSSNSSERLPVIVSPYGTHGRLAGCCPSDLVKQVYFSSGKLRTSNGFIGLPNHVSQGPGCQLRGQSCYVEVTLGCHGAGNEKASWSKSNAGKKFSKPAIAETSSVGRAIPKGSPDCLSDGEKTFIYPSEAVLVPVLQTSFARSFLKRFWLQNWIGPSFCASSFFAHSLDSGSAGKIDSVDESWSEANGIRGQHRYNSSSNSNNSSISTLSSTSSDSDYKMSTGGGDLEADADSLTCRQRGLSSNDQLENDYSKLGLKRPRNGMSESIGQVGPMQEAYKSDYGSAEANNSSATGVTEQLASQWDWNDSGGLGIDIQSLLSEFGDFGDFFEADIFPIGEPPGTAESQAIVISAPDVGDVANSSPGIMDVSDQILLPEGFPSFDSFIPPPSVVIDEPFTKIQEVPKTTLPSSGPVNYEFDHLVKAEALMTFAPEYGAVETPTSETSSIFKSPYLPKSRKAESLNSTSNSYVYGATLPSSPFDGSVEKATTLATSKTTKNYYTHIESGKEQLDRKLVTCNNNSVSCDGFRSTHTVNSALKKATEGTLGPLLLSSKTVLATEIECVAFQYSMCKMRHTLTSGSPQPTGLSMGLNQLPCEPSTMTDGLSSKYEVKKKESIPSRIAGDTDGGILDGPGPGPGPGLGMGMGSVNAPVGVWRSVGVVTKGAKPTNLSSIEVCPPLHHNLFNEEGRLSYGQRQPLLELLDGLGLLVQQATSFVDVALDADCGDGPYGWLALQEQLRRGFSCGPSMVHAGCGGILASCHFLDIAGMELLDPLSVDVHAASVISLLQSDVKAALKSAFGILDGPLSVIEWCKGRNQSGDVATVGDGFSGESTVNEGRDSSSSVTLSIGEPISPSLSSLGGSSSLKVDETSQRRSNQEIGNWEAEQQQLGSRLRPTLFVLPLPSILVGYQDDWLKVSASCLQLWEKAPLEPYAKQKPMAYYVICPDIDPLISAAVDFFQQLGNVYETCNLGSHSPQNLGNHTEINSGKWSSSGLVLLDCPQSMKIESSNNASIVGSISDYFLSLSNGWDLTSFQKSLSKVLKALRLGSLSTTNPKEGNVGSCTVIYVVCPFPEPITVLQTIIEASAAIGSTILSSDKERRSILQNQVGKALNCSAAVDEASASNVLTLSGFSVPKLVLQIVTVDAIFRVTNPALNELIILKEIAFTVYNKARRISRGFSSDSVQTGRSNSVMQMNSPVPGMWKDCVASRMAGPTLPREGEVWDNSWQSSRSGGYGVDQNRTSGDFLLQDDLRYMFEPLFILPEPGSLEHGVSPTDSSKPLADDGSSIDTVTGPSGQLDGPELDGYGLGHQKSPPSLHCCYGWTEDWRWLVCIWTDSRGELLDSHIFPFGGISSRQDTKGLQCLFVQVLQQGCQILQSCCSPDTGVVRPRDIVITRIGCFYELECQEWQKAIYLVGGSEVKKWPLQLRRSSPDGMAATSNGPSMQQQEMGLIQERALPSSPSPLYNPHSKASGFMKGGLGQPTSRKQHMGVQVAVDSSKGLLQWVQSISLIGVSIDHSLQLVFQADSSSPGGPQASGTMGASSYLEGFTPVKSLGSTQASYVLIPSPSMRFLPPTPLQIPTCLTADSPPLAHLLHSKGYAVPLSTGFLVSKAVPSMRKDSKRPSKDEWPSVLSISLVDYFGGGSNFTTPGRGVSKRGLSLDGRDVEIETRLILESVSAELHALSWLTVSPAYLDRRTALPCHCDMVLRLRRLLHFAEKELSRQHEKTES